MKYKICLVTGNRADYGMLKNLLFELKKKNLFNLSTIVTGAHLEKQFGYTIKKIIQDKVKISKKINIKIKKDKPDDIINSISTCLKKFSNIFKKRKPDLIILLGDRYEIFSVAVASIFHNIPIAHIHGGEITEGAIDDILRHSITKMAYYHFAATHEYKKNIIQLGEEPHRVYNVGGLGVDSIKKTKFLSKNKLCKFLKIDVNKKIIMVNFHPETKSKISYENQIKIILESIKTFKNVQFIFTMPNPDTGNKIVINKIKNFVNTNKNCYFFSSLGEKKFYSLMRYSSAMLGNSSSGYLEIPTFRKITIDIGDRQKGRIKSNTIIRVSFNKNIIKRVINKVLNSEQNYRNIKSSNPYGKGGAATKISNILEKIVKNKINNKKFYKIDEKKKYLKFIQPK